MKPAPFSYHAPATIGEATGLLARLDTSLPLAGGQSLIPLLNLRLVRPSHLVDLAGLADLRWVEANANHVSVGAMTTHRTVERHSGVIRHFPLLARAVSYVGFPAIRSRGTVGGSLAHADPAGELPLVALITGAEISLEGLSTARVVPADEFFVSAFTTVRRSDEIVTRVKFPVWPTAGFSEFSRRSGDFAIVAAAVVARLEAGVVAEARIGVAGIGDRPLRVSAAEGALVGMPIGEVAADLAATAAARAVDPLGDIHGSPDFRRRLVATQVRKAVLDMLDKPHD